MHKKFTAAEMVDLIMKQQKEYQKIKSSYSFIFNEITKQMNYKLRNCVMMKSEKPDNCFLYFSEITFKNKNIKCGERSSLNFARYVLIQCAKS